MRLFAFCVLLVISSSMALACDTCDQTENTGHCPDCGKTPHMPRSLSGSTDRNYLTDFERVKEAAIQAVQEEAHVNRDQIKVTDDAACSCGHVSYVRAKYIEFSCIKVKIDDRGKDSGMPEVSVTITTDTVFFTRHKEYEQRIHELVLMKLKARTHGDESRVTMLTRTTKPIPMTPADRPEAVSPPSSSITPSLTPPGKPDPQPAAPPATAPNK